MTEPAKRMFQEKYEAAGYSLGKELGDGKGNTARVFRAKKDDTGEEFAIKFYNPVEVDINQKKSKIEPERFWREFLAVRDIKHPNVVRVLECGNISDDPEKITLPPFMVVELLDGDLRKKMTPGMPVTLSSLPDTVRLLRKIAEGLDAVHKAKVIHRDIKPDNIMFKADEPKVADFGFAKLYDETILKGDALAQRRRTEAGERLGTMDYASPEQIIAALDVTDRADVFSFGVMAYELLTGVLPFPREAFEDMDDYVKRRVKPPRLEADSLDPEFPFALRDLCVRCLIREPLERPVSSSLADTLRQIESTLYSEGPTHGPV